MHSTREIRMTRLRLFGTACLALLLGGCTTKSQSAPMEMGPSGFGQLLTLTATPDVLARDGSSQSVIRLNFRDGVSNDPLVQRRIVLQATAGSLSAGEVVTDSGGNASVTLTAPGLDTPMSTATISALPVGSNVDNAVQWMVRVRLLGPGFPNAVFTYTPSAPAQFQNVFFNASGTTLEGSPCGTACSYSWDFGDGSSGTGRSVEHAFQSQGSKPVTLTVTSPYGTTASTMQTIQVGSPSAPTASFTFSPTNPNVGDTVFFDASASAAANGATISEYRWNFGNGLTVTTTGPTTSTIFGSARGWRVTMTVVDSNGQTAVAEQTVTAN